jgi:hypothetical protein
MHLADDYDMACHQRAEARKHNKSLSFQKTSVVFECRRTKKVAHRSAPREHKLDRPTVATRI